MKRGNLQHEKILNSTLEELKQKGYKTINLNSKSPTAISFKFPISEGIIINKGKKKTITYLEDTYFMFDKIKRIVYTENEDKNDVLKSVKKNYEGEGYRFIYLENKSPDGIVFDKDNKVFAIEIIGKNVGYSFESYKKNKEDLYHMFDGVMFKTFFYDTNTEFTETFGRSVNICGVEAKGSGV